MQVKDILSAARGRAKIGFVGVGAVIMVLLLWMAAAGGKPAKRSGPPPVSVAVARAQIENVPLSIDTLGRAQAWQSVVIRAQVNGTLSHVYFREGGDVKAGAVLAEIDPAPYQAALLQAQGALTHDRALLAAARVDLKRYQTLVKQDSIAVQQVDTQAALVKQDEGLVAADEGAVAAARVNVKRCRIVSPISGRAGVRLVDAGNVVSTNDTNGIVTINQISPIAVTFTVPQGDFQRLSELSHGFTAPLAATALSQETGAPLGEGELSIADNHVDASTGTVMMKARFPNADKRLWPGQFVNVRLTLQTLRDALTVPVSAVTQGPSGAYVYLVGFDRKVTMRPIEVAAMQGDVAVIKSGLRADDIVVTDGQMSLKPGMTVAIRKAAPKKASA